MYSDEYIHTRKNKGGTKKGIKSRREEKALGQRINDSTTDRALSVRPSVRLSARLRRLGARWTADVAMQLLIIVIMFFVGTEKKKNKTFQPRRHSPLSSTRLAASIRRRNSSSPLGFVRDASVRPRTHLPRLATTCSTKSWSSLDSIWIAGEWGPPLVLSRSYTLVVSDMSDSATCLRSYSGDAPGVRMPPLSLVLLTSGKLRLVPVDSKDETDGRCSAALKVMLAGRCSTELARGLSSRYRKASSPLLPLPLPLPDPPPNVARRAVVVVSSNCSLGVTNPSSVLPPAVVVELRLSRPSAAVAKESTVTNVSWLARRPTPTVGPRVV